VLACGLSLRLRLALLLTDRCCCRTPVPPPAGELLASTTAQPLPLGATSAVASFALSGPGGAHSAAIDALTTRIMPAHQAAAGGVAAAAAQQAGYPLSYVVSWAVDRPAAEAASEPQQGAAAAGEAALALVAGAAGQQAERLLLRWPTGQPGPAAAAAAGLAALQQLAGLAPAGGLDVRASLRGAGLVERPSLLPPGAPAGSSPGAAATWGLLRTAASEAPGTSFRLLDGGGGGGGGGGGDGPRPSSPRAGESSGVLDAAAQRSGLLLSQQLAAADLAESPEWVQIRPEPRASLANLVARGADLAGLAPGAGEVLLNVKAVGVNFRDVLNVLGGRPSWRRSSAAGPVVYFAALLKQSQLLAGPVALCSRQWSDPLSCPRRHVPRRPRRPRQRLRWRGAGRRCGSCAYTHPASLVPGTSLSVPGRTTARRPPAAPAWYLFPAVVTPAPPPAPPPPPPAAAGPGVAHLRPGDSVFGLAHGCLGTVVRGPAAQLAPMPACVTHQEAATMPTVFITVDVALNQAARAGRGDRVLVHAGAGGVGLAALQVGGGAWCLMPAAAAAAAAACLPAAPPPPARPTTHPAAALCARSTSPRGAAPRTPAPAAPGSARW
jgi:hypothetical protein